jgi:predicted methyltransferase
MILSSTDFENINQAIKNNKDKIEISLDLNLTKTSIKIKDQKLILNNKSIEIPKTKTKNCYLIKKGKLEPIQFFSQETNSLYKLIPTSNKPLLQISGTSMHKKEFVDLIKKDKPKGILLDSGTGLGYTAIQAAKTADKVITIELDPNVIEITKINPWSQELFTNKKIESKQGDLEEELINFPNNYFNHIIQDTGEFKKTGNLFSLSHYQQIFNKLKPRGTFYHYVPQPQKTKGRSLVQEIIPRLKQAGFKKIEQYEKESAVKCTKF